MSQITIQTTIQAPIEKVWEFFNGVEHYKGWSFAADTWAAEGIENTVKVGGKIKVRNYAKDGSMSFYFEGIYKEVELHKLMSFDLTDGRNVTVRFENSQSGVVLTETFDAEKTNAEDFQKAGWQAYLDNFKKYTESH